ncbi:MAG: carboxypeptidase regulatory-like domain-containing protein [Myxococcota bacterium]|nr:carboxypeptidase regulatory-like domain-containing protein [Myxococcota bacterium]
MRQSMGLVGGRVKDLTGTLAVAGLLVLTLFPLTAIGAAKYKEGAVAGGGSVSGTVKFSGTVPEPESMAINKDMEVCGGDHRLHETVKVASGGLSEVVVALKGVKEGKAWDPEIAKANVLQEKCAFLPYLQIMKKGGDLEVKNGDAVSHNIHTYEMIGRARVSQFNVQQPAGSSFNKPIKMRRGNVIRMECDQHDFMIGWAYVPDNPYYAVVAADGTFSIADVPAGTYKAEAWHPYLGIKKGKVTVEAGGAAALDFEFK